MTWTGLKAIDSFGFISFINFGLRFFQLLRIGFFLEKLTLLVPILASEPCDIYFPDLELVKGQHIFGLFWTHPPTISA